MNLPIQFPNAADVIAEEAAQFRTLSPEMRVRTLGEMFLLYHFLAEHSAKPEAVARFAQTDEDCARSAIEAFAARHA